MAKKKKNKKKKKKHIIGIDLGGTKMLTALFDERFRILSSTKMKTEVSKGEKHFVSGIAESIWQVMDESEADLKSLKAIGIGCPGIIDDHGVVIESPNIRFLKHYPLAKKISKIFKVPVVLENDVNAGLYGEFAFGAAKGHRHVIGIFPGTGIGGALILNGELYRGFTGAAGEIGHTLVDSMGPMCGCGRRGCLEALAGRLAIASEAALLAAKQQAPKLFKMSGTDLKDIKSGALKRAIDAGDQKVKDLMVYKSRILGIAMANAVNVLNPEMVVLGGGLVEAMSRIIVNESRESMKQHAMQSIAKHVKVVPAQLKDDAIILGAAKLAWDSYMKKKKG